MENVREVINQFKNNGNKPAEAKIQVYDDEKKNYVMQGTACIKKR